MNKKQLLYECVTEAFVQARIEVQRSGLLSYFESVAIDNILSNAQRTAGKYVLNVYEVDARKIKHHSEITSKGITE